MEEAARGNRAPSPDKQAGRAAADEDATGAAPRALVHGFDARRLWAYARREAMEIFRDPIRITFSLLGPVAVMLTVGYGISFDVENLKFAVFDHDRTLESRELIEQFSGSRYFEERPPIASEAELDRRLESGELKVALEIPPSFGKDFESGKRPEVLALLDGAMPFRAETTRGYLQLMAQSYAAEQVARGRSTTVPNVPVKLETRFRYNQAFKSVFAITPGIIMMLLMNIPAMMTALGVVREKESGSIANFRSTPITGVEFLLGKQLPYVVIALVSFSSLLLLAVFLFEVPVTGSFAALLAGVFVYVCAATGFGLLISCFTTTQVAAIFAASVLTITPCANFSGLLVPVSALSGPAQAVSYGYPAGWFMQVSLGAFTKRLGFVDLWPDIAVIGGFAVLFVAVAVAALRKQET